MEKEEIEFLRDRFKEIKSILEEIKDFYNYDPEMPNENVPKDILKTLMGLRYAISNIVDRISSLKLQIFIKQNQIN